MPELPEVQSIVNYLNGQKIPGKTIETIISPNGYEPTYYKSSLSNFKQFLKNKIIHKINRKGKFIVIELNEGFLSFHLRMTGKFLHKLNDIEEKKYISLQINFNDQSSLYFKDIRKFGKAYISKDIKWLENKLGIEPLSKNFNFQWMKNKFMPYKKMIKPLLLDQKIIAGLGNIYIDEALWYSKIHPKSITSKISSYKIKLLNTFIKKILKKALKHNGTTIINFSYGNNVKGDFKKKLKVFGRENELCERCNMKITKIFLYQRGTHFCKNCQKLY